MLMHRLFLYTSVRWLGLQRNREESGIPLSLEKLRFSSEHGLKRNSPSPAPSAYYSEHALFEFVQLFVLSWFPKNKEVLTQSFFFGTSLRWRTPHKEKIRQKKLGAY